MRMQLVAALTTAVATSLASGQLLAIENNDGEEEVSTTEQVSGAESTDAPARQRLRALEAKYQKTGDARYLFERLLTLEQLGEYEFALEILKNNRERFESHDEVDGVAVVEQRLRDRLSNGAESTPRRRSDARGTDLVGWTLTGAGTLALAGGISQIVVAEHRANRLRCSPVARGPSADGCRGLDSYGNLTREEFNQKKSGVERRRWIGIGLAGLGTAAAGWGVYRLIDARRSSDSSTQAAHLRWTAGWMPGGLTMRARIRFF